MTDQTPEDLPATSPADQLGKMVDVAAVPEVAGFKTGSPEHFDAIGKVLVLLHAELASLRTHVAAGLADAEGAAEKVIRL